MTRKKNIVIGIIVIGAILTYGALWLMTAYRGKDRVQFEVELELWPSPQLIMKYDGRGVRENRHIPYIFCSTTACAPFLVLADYGHNMKDESEYSCIELFLWTPRGVSHLLKIRERTETIDKAVKDSRPYFRK